MNYLRLSRRLKIKPQKPKKKKEKKKKKNYFQQKNSPSYLKFIICHLIQFTLKHFEERLNSQINMSRTLLRETVFLSWKKQGNKYIQKKEPCYSPLLQTG